MKAGAALFLAPALVLALACFPQDQCDPSTIEYCATGDTTCAGHLVDAYTWESGPLDATWLDFRHNRTWHMHMRDAVTGATIQGNVYDVQSFISATQTPDQFTIAGGNLTEWHLSSDGSIDVHNDTCAEYFVHVVVHAEPSTQDASTE